MFDPIVAVNGVVGAGISPLDRGFNYGDGLFETVRLTLVDGRAVLPLWPLHQQRLLRDCQRFGISLPEALLEEYVAQVRELAERHAIESAVLKVVVSRGVGGRGYLASESMVATVCVGLYPAAEHPVENGSTGIAAHLCRQVLSSCELLAGAKHLNKLEYVLARNEWRDKPVAEGVLCDASGLVVEGSFSNIFWVRDGKLMTPALDFCGVAGVMRQLILEVLAPAGSIPTQIQSPSLAELEAADEVFFCNSVYGIWPLLSLAGYRWRKGEVTSGLQLALVKYLQGELHA